MLPFNKSISYHRTDDIELKKFQTIFLHRLIFYPEHFQKIIQDFMTGNVPIDKSCIDVNIYACDKEFILSIIPLINESMGQLSEIDFSKFGRCFEHTKLYKSDIKRTIDNLEKLFNGDKINFELIYLFTLWRDAKILTLAKRLFPSENYDSLIEILNDFFEQKCVAAFLLQFTNVNSSNNSIKILLKIRRNWVLKLNFQIPEVSNEEYKLKKTKRQEN